MSLTAEQVAEIIAGGESPTVEFKTSTPADHLIGQVLASFANTDGGILLVGVNDSGEVAGLSAFEAEYACRHLLRVAASLLRVPVEIDAVALEERYVVYASVPKVPTDALPVMTSSGSVFVREGSAIVQAPSAGFYRPDERRQVEQVRPGRKVRIFVAMSLREEEEPALADYFRAMERAVLATGLPIELVRVDLVDGDYEISRMIMDVIDECEIVLADFTLSPGNVYFEVGYARGKGKRIVQTARAESRLEFDVRNWRTLFYRNATELESRLRDALRIAYAETVSGSPNIGTQTDGASHHC